MIRGVCRRCFPRCQRQSLPAARGRIRRALIGEDNTLTEEPGQGPDACLYLGDYPAQVHETLYRNWRGDISGFFRETGLGFGIFPGSLHASSNASYSRKWSARIRLARAARFGNLRHSDVRGIFLGDYLAAAEKGGANEHGYWMATFRRLGIFAANPEYQAKAAGMIGSFPAAGFLKSRPVVYRAIGSVPGKLQKHAWNPWRLLGNTRRTWTPVLSAHPGSCPSFYQGVSASCQYPGHPS